MTNQRSLTNNFSKQNGQLRVLWIDDNAAVSQPIPSYKRDWMIYHAINPKGVKHCIEMASVGLDPETEEIDELKQTPTAPFDIYLCDFRLTATSDPKTNKGDPASADAAGFLLGVLSSLKWPRSPQAIIPYSAFISEYASTFNLVSEFCPDSIVMLKEPKGKYSNINDSLEVAAHTYRVAVMKSFSKGHLLLDDDTVAALPKLISGAKDEDLDIDSMLGFKTADGQRRFRLSSLFFDNLDASHKNFSTYSNITEFLETFEADRFYESCKKLADDYWSFYQDPRSHEQYTAWEVYLSEGRAMKPPSFVETAGPKKSIVYKLEGPEKDFLAKKQIRTLMLFLKHFRQSKVVNLVAEMTEQEFRDALKSDHESSELLAIQSDYADVLSALNVSKVDLNFYRDLYDQYNDKFNTVRMIHPMPKGNDNSGDEPPSKKFNNDGRILRSMRHIKVTCNSLDDISIGDNIPSSYLRRYAREIGLKEDLWPFWLKR